MDGSPKCGELQDAPAGSFGGSMSSSISSQPQTHFTIPDLHVLNSKLITSEAIAAVRNCSTGGVGGNVIYMSYLSSSLHLFICFIYVHSPPLIHSPLSLIPLSHHLSHHLSLSLLHTHIYSLILRVSSPEWIWSN